MFRNKVGYGNVVRKANCMVLDGGYMVDSELQVSTGRRQSLHADVLDVENRDVILGMEWLRENKVKIDCVRNHLEFEDGEVWKCDPYPLPTINQKSCHEALFNSKHLIMISNSELHLLGKLTSNDQANRLPSHSNFDHSMIFKTGSKIPNGPLYRLTWEEEEALMRYLDQMTAEGKI